MIAPAQSRGWSAPPGAASTADDLMIRFTIAPAHDGAWLWRTFYASGEARAQGFASTRKQAAALVIRDILMARTENAAPQILELSAKAA